MPSPLEAYQQKIKQDDLQPDDSQQEAVRELQRLYDELSLSPSWGEGRGEGRITARFKKLVLSLLSHMPLTPPLSPQGEGLRGVYLWGGVGRGKSMLMDLFFACLPEDLPKRRVHFHQFLIETHDFLHKARQEK